MLAGDVLDGPRPKTMIVLRHLIQNFPYLGMNLLLQKNHDILNCPDRAGYQYCVQAFEGQALEKSLFLPALRFFRQTAKEKA